MSADNGKQSRRRIEVGELSVPRTEITLSDGSTVTFDEAYLKESLVDPKAKFAEGFDKASNPAAAEMPAFGDKLTPQVLADLVAYLKSL